ncbi:MAG: alpha-1,4-glucan--maltose-1-phosphate maltosyltransferase [Fibrobacterota bacterium]
MKKDGRIRAVVEHVTPCVDGGRFPIKRVEGESVTVWADCFADGHDVIDARLMYRRSGESQWSYGPMEFVDNDRWRGGFRVDSLGTYEYAVQCWVDHFLTWRHGLEKKFQAAQEQEADYLIGLEILNKARSRVNSNDAPLLEEVLKELVAVTDRQNRFQIAHSRELLHLLRRNPDTELAVTSTPLLKATVDRKRAAFSSWYEFFPRSCTSDPARHGKLRDCEHLLSEIAQMGFDVVYLPPVHPIGEVNRKGKNNSVTAALDDPGSPWAIGSRHGGHKAIEPRLGTVEDFEHFLGEVTRAGLEVAIDVAFQCAPDHPYVKEHPEWFTIRPDGTIQFAENPPKKYEDIVPFNFETDAWESLWKELKSVFFFWIDRGVRIFRVDNPHTKPFPFWEWLIAEVKKEYPEVLFLAEAFTRPKVMNRLAKLGFSQSYTYFTWRNTKEEITRYMVELTRGEQREFFRPNFWPNTPDILPELLQFGGENAFAFRLVLAATLSSNYGLYGPAYEQAVNKAVPGREEYEYSEKYQIYAWDRSKGERLRKMITALNRARKENPALQSNRFLEFYPIDNDYMLFYGKRTPDLSNVILAVVNLDPFHVQKGKLKVPLYELGIEPSQTYLLEDLLGGDRYVWHSEENEITLDPSVSPASLFRVHRQLRREADFDYY